jgi:predicted nuclease with TOPRIM domain
VSAGFQALRRKLERWELEHLREHCAEQAERIEQLERELRDVQCVAEQWQSEVEALREDVGTRGGVVHLYRDGSMAIAYSCPQVTQ